MRVKINDIWYDSKDQPISPVCSIALPKITDGMIDQFYPWLIADAGAGWTYNDRLEEQILSQLL